VLYLESKTFLACSAAGHLEEQAELMTEEHPNKLKTPKDQYKTHIGWKATPALPPHGHHAGKLVLLVYVYGRASRH
jgi:hypothetical protein